MINDGKKSFAIDGNESRVIRFNPCDFNIYIRAEEVAKEIDELQAKLGKSKKSDETKLKELSEFIKKRIDYILNAEVSNIVFEKQSPLTFVEGIPYYMQFLNALKPIIDNAIETQRKLSNEKILEYTKKYEGGK